jgi:hypothetical protein
MGKGRIWIKKNLMNISKENFNEYEYENIFTHTLPYPLTALMPMFSLNKKALLSWGLKKYTCYVIISQSMGVLLWYWKIIK